MIIAILVSFFLLLFLGMPIAFTMGSVTAGMLFLEDVSLELLVQRMFAGVDSFSLLALPLFILAGNIMGKGGLTKRLIRLANAIVGKLSGGLGMTSVVTSALFGSVSGSTVATTFAVGSVMVPKMQEQKYSNAFTASILGPAGILGLIIPPSITMVILGITTNISIGELFIAGLIPGILLTVIFCIYVAIMSKKKGYGVVEQEKITWKEFFHITKEAFLPLMTPVFILGGIFSGLVTATEAAVIAVLYGLLLSLYYRELTFRNFKGIMTNSAVTSASILIIISVANAFAYVLTTNRIPDMISNFFLQYADTTFQFLLMVSVILLVLGMMMEVTTLIILLGPIFMPIAMQFGVDPVHFGIVLIMNFALANITPPVGLSVIAGCSITDRNMGIEDTLPYILHVIAIVALVVLIIILFPAISTFLPSLFA
ncbi:TRAP transporter large permease [Alkalibacillus haloalkaliphilus]|uniref:TRAP transporter large permease n=1 Tax=Alkalibacillus haloalkaliphilus TaxID=94136 RepID=UPI00293655C8|nr:TRAP transporter large permease [Alkalibacillus haloalkaliphilus]MDV2582175.1 TRAP transporter large permease [Alkalibacillus haloalkaliphilus]